MHTEGFLFFLALANVENWKKTIITATVTKYEKICETREKTKNRKNIQEDKKRQ